LDYNRPALKMAGAQRIIIIKTKKTTNNEKAMIEPKG
jgi:hypothetical protein